MSQAQLFFRLWLLGGLLVLGLFAASQGLRLGQGANNWWHDLIDQMPGLGPQAKPETIVVTVDAADWHDPAYPWPELLHGLQAASLVALVGCPVDCTHSRSHPALGGILRGLAGAQHSDLAPTERALGRPVLDGGTLRWWHSQAEPSFGQAVLNAGNDPARWPLGVPFRLRIDESTRVPLLQAQQIVDKRLPAGFFQGRTVLIGLALPPGQAGYRAPAQQADESGMPLVETAAYALETVRHGRLDTAAPPAVSIAAMWAICGVSILLHLALALTPALLTGLAVSLMLLIACWLLRIQAALWIPLFDLYLTQWVSAAFVATIVLRKEDRRLREVMTEVAGQVQERLIPANLLGTEDPWELALRFTREVLGVQRQILLECIPGENRVREIAADGYSLDQIVERRRDYRRPPYTDALAAGGVVRNQRQFMDTVPGEIQYIAPLQFAGQLFGFWAFSIDASSGQRDPQWRSLAEEARSQVSELLFHQREWLRRKARGSDAIELTLPNKRRNLVQNLIAGVSLLERRITQMEQASNRLHTSYLLYDLFGNLIQANAPAEALARNSDLRIYGCSAFEMLAQLFGDDQKIARGLINDVFIGRSTVSRPVTGGSRPLFLNLHPVMRERASRGDDAMAPFQLAGILLELVDYAEVWRLLQRRHEFLGGLAGSIARDLRNLASAPTASRRALTGVLHAAENMEREAQRLHPVYDSLQTPTDIANLFMHVCAELEPLAQRKGLTWNLPPMQPGCFVLNDPARLEDAMAGILAALLEDAFDGSTIDITLWTEISSRALVIRATASGVGLPEDSLDAVLKGEVAADEAHWSELVYWLRHLQELGAELHGSSSIGRHTSFDIILPPPAKEADTPAPDC